MNRVILIGNVGADPKVKYLDSGDSVAKISLATTESYKNKAGEKVTNTEWHNVVFWRGLAKVVKSYVIKGAQLSVEGKITYRSYEKDGQTKYYTEIVASSMEMLGRKQDNTGTQAGTATPANYEADSPIDLNAEDSDDLPF